MNCVHFYQSLAKPASFGNGRPKMTNTDDFVLRTSLKPFITFKPSLESVRLFWDDNVMKITDTAASSSRDCLSLFHMPVLNIETTETQLKDNVHLPYCRRNLMMLQLNEMNPVSPIYVVIAQRMMIYQHLRSCYSDLQWSRHWNKGASAVHTQ